MSGIIQAVLSSMTTGLSFDPTKKGSYNTLSNNNKTVRAFYPGGVSSALCNREITIHDKVMFSMTIDNWSRSDHDFIGICNSIFNYNGNFLGQDTSSLGFCCNGSLWINNQSSVTMETNIFENNTSIIDICVNNVNKFIWIRVNGWAWNGAAYIDPATNSGITFDLGGGSIYPAVTPSAAQFTINPLPIYTVPSGFTFI